MTFRIVLLDYGHGGMIEGVYQTAGKQYHFTDQRRPLSIYEGVVNRRIAAKLATMLIPHVRVFDVVANRELTSEYVAPETLTQADVSLSQRVANANAQRVDAVLVSIHANAIGAGIEGPSQSARGASVYTSRGTTGSDAVATSVVDALDSVTPLRVRRDMSDGDADYEADFYVLHRTAMPAILSENGFFTNIDDARFLLSDEGSTLIAKAHFEGLRAHIRR